MPVDYANVTRRKAVIWYESSSSTQKLKPAFFSLPEAAVESELTVCLKESLEVAFDY